MAFMLRDDFDENLKVMAAGAAISTWVRCATWSSRNETDGFVPVAVVRRYSPRGRGAEITAQKLVDVGLWEAVDGGWIFHDWLDHQESRAEKKARRVSDRERKAASRMHPETPPDSPRTHAGGTAGAPRMHPQKKELPGQRGSVRPESTRIAGAGSLIPKSQEIEQKMTTSSSVAVPAANQDQRNAPMIVNNWWEACKIKPDRRMYGRMLGEVQRLLDAGHSWDIVNHGLHDWHIRGFVDPSKLAMVVFRLENPRTATYEPDDSKDDRVLGWLSMSARAAEQERKELES